jgi:nitronate monooxygenase
MKSEVKPMLKTPIMDLFKLIVPIIQAPMAGVSTPKLAAAVSNAGGLGSISIGASSIAQAKQMIEETQSQTKNPYNVNVFCHQPARRDPVTESAWLHHLTPLFRSIGVEPPISLNEIYQSFLEGEDIFQLLLTIRPPIISFHFGLPSIDRLIAFREAGIKMMATATNLIEAKLIEEAGIDAIVVQGIEAGGHRGVFDSEQPDTGYSTSVLVRLMVEQVNIPVIAAGGIMDGHGIKAALELGASGVQLGTAFILCPESAANNAYRTALKSEKAYDTIITSAISGRPARGLPNRLTEHVSDIVNLKPAAYPLTYDATKILDIAATACGKDDFAVRWAGQGAPLAREMPAGELIKELVKEMQFPRNSYIDGSIKVI